MHVSIHIFRKLYGCLLDFSAIECLRLRFLHNQ
uniref:Uncharacterized protein n=1 Tax=Anguilla anguilla TaxID=7936 RepID=A0A0E9QYF9_ANGAN